MCFFHWNLKQKTLFCRGCSIAFNCHVSKLQGPTFTATPAGQAYAIGPISTRGGQNSLRKFANIADSTWWADWCGQGLFLDIFWTDGKLLYICIGLQLWLGLELFFLCVFQDSHAAPNSRAFESILWYALRRFNHGDVCYFWIQSCSSFVAGEQMALATVDTVVCKLVLGATTKQWKLGSYTVRKTGGDIPRCGYLLLVSCIPSIVMAQVCYCYCTQQNGMLLIRWPGWRVSWLRSEEEVLDAEGKMPRMQLHPRTAQMHAVTSFP